MRYTLMFLCIFITGYTQAQVYRSVDKDGNVIFTDQATEGAVEVEIKELETIKSIETTSPAPSKPAEVERYASLEITSPQSDLAIRDNAGNLTVTVSVTPRLRSGDKLVLYLDGTEQDSGQSPSFELQNVDRGTHQLRVAVIGRDGQEQISSLPVSFNMLRFSAANPNTAKPPPKPTPNPSRN